MMKLIEFFRKRNNNKTKNDQERLFNYLEYTLRFYLVKLKRGESESAITFVKRLNEIFERFGLLKISNPSKFKLLYYNKEISSNKDYPNTGINFPSFLLNFKRPYYAVDKLLEYYERIFKVSIEQNNDALFNEIVASLIKILNSHISESGNEGVTHLLLAKLRNFEYYVSDKIPYLQYRLLLRWYFDVLQNSVSSIGIINHKLSYQPILEDYFWENIKYIISNEKSLIFYCFISYIYEGVPYPFYTETSIYKLDEVKTKKASKLYNDLIELTTLETRKTGLRNINGFYIWVKDFEEFVKRGEAAIEESDLNNFTQKVEEIKVAAYEYLLYNNLTELVYLLGMYCLFKGKILFIYELWKYNQPDDADASWGQNNILPQSMPALFKFLEIKEEILNKVTFRWDQHHGAEPYFYEYFLINVIKLVDLNKFDNQITYTIANGLTEVQSIDNFIIEAERLKAYVKLPKLGEDGLKSLNLKYNISDDSEKLKNLLTGVIDASKNRKAILIRRLSLETSSLKEPIISAFENARGVVNLFKSIGRYIISEDVEAIQTKEMNENLSELKQAVLVNDNGYEIVGYVGMTFSYSENDFLISQLNLISSGQVISDTVDNVKGLINKSFESIANLDNLIILSINFNLFRLFDISKDKLDEEDVNNSFQKLDSYLGYYQYGPKRINTFTIHESSYQNLVFVLDIESMSPVKQGFFENEDSLLDIKIILNEETNKIFFNISEKISQDLNSDSIKGIYYVKI